MKALTWILAGVSVGLVTYIVLNQPGPQYATGNDDVEDLAGEATLWGSKQRIKGTGRQLFGKAKEAAGRAIGDEELAGEGLGDQVIGVAKDAAGAAAQAVGDTIHAVNR
jgi:uncharacterized protein YjbJ (UPF0337 family)